MKPTNFTSEIGETQNCGQSRPMRLKKVEALQRISQMRKDTEDLNEKSDSNFDSDICESASLCPGKHSYTEVCICIHTYMHSLLLTYVLFYFSLFKRYLKISAQKYLHFYYLSMQLNLLSP